MFRPGILKWQTVSSDDLDLFFSHLQIICPYKSNAETLFIHVRTFLSQTKHLFGIQILSAICMCHVFSVYKCNAHETRLVM